MPNVRIANATINAGIKGVLPNVRISSYQTTRSGETRTFIESGTPIGLLLALTYASQIAAGSDFYGDTRPNVRIQTI